MRNGKSKLSKPKMKITGVYHLAKGDTSWSIVGEEVWKNPDVFPILVEKDEKGDYDMQFDGDALLVNYRLQGPDGVTNEVFSFAWEQGF